MEFQLQSNPDAEETEAPTETLRADGSFSISSLPVVEQTAARKRDPDEPEALPRSRDTQSLWLMPRDPAKPVRILGC